MPEALRVALVTDGLYPFFAGGKEVRLWELARRVASPAVAVEVHTMRWWGDGETVPEWQGVPLRPLCRPWAMYAGPWRSVWQATMFAFGSLRLATAKVDVVDADHMPYLHLLPLRLVTRLKRVPLVVTWHEWWGRQYWAEYLGKLGPFSAALERLSARCADHLIVDSTETYQRLLEEGIPAERMSLLTLGADLDAIAAASPAPQSWDVLYAGRLIEHKRVDVLLDALAQLRDQGTDLRCLVVGSGPEEQRLREKAAALGLLTGPRVLAGAAASSGSAPCRGDCVTDGAGVSFLGSLPHQADVWALMKSSRVFAYPSVREGFGLAVLEAQAAGATVVTTDHPDNHGRLLVEHGPTGYLCGTSAQQLAGAIALALERPASNVALRAHVARHSWGPRAGQLGAIYRSLARNGRGA